MSRAVTKHKSANVSQAHANRTITKEDQRVARTRRQLDSAFVELLLRRAYGNIRVSDIARKAGVGRATFYAHYSSKDDLLRSQFGRIVAPMLATKPGAPCPLDASALFAHVGASPRIYQSLMGSREAGHAPRIMRECFEHCARLALALRRPNAPLSGNLREAIVTRFVASSLLSVIECSVERNAPESPQQLQEIFSGLVGRGLAALGGVGGGKN